MKRITTLAPSIVVAALALLASCGRNDPRVVAPIACGEQRVADGSRLLVYSRTLGFRHGSIGDGVTALREIGEAHGFAIEHTEDPTRFTDDGLRPFVAVVFLNTTGDVLDSAQQAALARYVSAGRGWIGVHSASDTEYDWPWYRTLVGAYFARHPAIQPAIVSVNDTAHPSTRCIPTSWSRTDEWYDFQSQPIAGATVLASVDEGSYTGGGMGAVHPVSWAHAVDGGRAWYTAMGHTPESYEEKAFRDHLLGGILWVTRSEEATRGAGGR
jgi:type 1 glutamine amidotransferase